MITWAEQFHHSESQVQLKSENGNHSEISLIKQTRRYLMKCFHLHDYIILHPINVLDLSEYKPILMSIVFQNYKKLFQLSKSNIKFAMDLT